MAAVEHYYAEGIGVATTSPHTTWREVAVIPDPGWAAETFYLVLASALVRHYSSADQAQVRLTIGGVTLPDGALSYELTGSVQKAHYGWMYFLSNKTGDQALEVSSSGGSEVTVEWGAIFVLNLDDAGLGDVDFFTGEIFTDTATTASFVDQAATVGLTANGADTWLVIGNAMYTGVSGSSNHMMRLNDSVAGALATIDVEGEDATNDVRGYLLMAAVTPSAGSHTFSVQAAHESASCTVLSSRILAINLSACFAQHAVSRDTAQQQPATTPSWTTTRAINPTPGVTGPWLVWGAFGNDVNSLSNDLAARLQINPDGSGLASDPAYGDAAPGADGWDPTDITPFHLFTLATLSAGAARAINLDVQLVAGTTLRVQERTLVAFGLEKPGAGGGVALAGTSAGMSVASGTLTVTGPGAVALAGLSAGSASASGSLSAASGTTFEWQVLVDWDGDGSFGHAASDISAYWVELAWRLGIREAFEAMADEAEATIELINTDGRFSPENPASPINGLVRPGLDVRIRAVLNGAPQAMYSGRLESVKVRWEPASGAQAGKSRAALICAGWKQTLQEVEVSIPLYVDWNTSEPIKHMLNDLGVPHALDGGVTMLPIYGDEGAKKAWEVIRELTEAERGRCFEARDGKVTWWQRHRMVRNVTVAGTVSHTAGSYKPYHVSYGYASHLSNSVRVQAYQREVEAASELLWALKQEIYIPAASSRSFEAALQRDVSLIPAAASSVTISDVTFSAGSATITSEVRGGMVVITATNSNTIPAVLTGLKVYATPISKRNPIVVEVEDAASVAAYGKRGARTMDLKALSVYGTARQIALYEIYRRGRPQGAAEKVSFRRKADGMDNAHLLAWEIGTRIAIDIPAAGPAREYFIIGEEHRLSAGGLHETTYDLEPADTQRYWLLGVAGASEMDQTTRVGY